MRRFIEQNLLDWKNKARRKPLALYGARQIGKTYALKDFAAKYFSNYHYFNFEEDHKLSNFFAEDLKTHRIIQELSLYQDKSIDIKNDLIIFDEIQTCPEAITSLKYFDENHKEKFICVAGSLLGLELNPASYPVGKIDLLNMSPMTFMEFLLACEDDMSYEFLSTLEFGQEINLAIHEQLNQKLQYYWITGGMPKAVSIFVNNKEEKNITDVIEELEQEQEALIRTALADIAKHSGKENSLHITKVWSFISSQLNQEQDESLSRFKFKGVLDGKKRYKDFENIFSWLEAANLIIKTHIANKAEPPLRGFIKENIFKLYNFDIGLLRKQSGLKAQNILDANYGTFKGFFVENFIAQELKALESKLGSLISWKEGIYEIEFLLSDSSGEILPLEIKSGKKKTSTSLEQFCQKYNSHQSIVMSWSGRNTLSNGRYFLPLYMPLEKYALRAKQHQ